MSVRVFSEIGPLRRVVVHAPGPEVDTMLPEMMHRLLFDDIIYGVDGRHEHRRFRRIMRSFGVEVLDSQDLLKEALRAAPHAIPALLEQVQHIDGLTPERLQRLAALTPDALGHALVCGIGSDDDQVDALYRDAPLPIPNLLFARDAAVSLGDRVVIGSMKSPARQREPILMRFVLQHHPELGGAEVLRDYSTTRPRLHLPHVIAPTIEGGDVLVLREGIVLVGISERTQASAADQLVEALRGDERFRAVVLVPMPAARSVMHLDTIFTRASEGECLVYAPMIMAGHRETIRPIVVELTQHDNDGVRHKSLLSALSSLGVDLEPLYCGGRDSYVQQAREQWTDGANCFCIRPGVILLYGRNRATAAELARHGYELIEVAGLPFDEERGEVLRPFRPEQKYALLLEGHELSRARGGPRCMTMPLWRDDA